MLQWINGWYHPVVASDIQNKTRNYYLDNLKFILIICVVTTHFALQLFYISHIKYLTYFIYLFHMPCFIFVNGFLAKRLNAGGKLRVDKIIVVFWMYLIFKYGNAFLEIIFGRDGDPELFFDSNAPWYLLALCFWYLSVPFLERIKSSYLIPGSICVGILVGYIKSIDDVFALSRVFVFFPFFIMGFCLPGKKLESFLDKKLRIPAIIILLAVFLGINLLWNEFIPVKDIVYGASPYTTALEGLARYGLLIRGIWYLAAVLVSMCVMLLVPRCKTFFSALGERTMQIYMTHIWIRNILVYVGFFEMIEKGPKLLGVAVMAGSVLLTFFLANKWLKWVFDLLMSPKLLSFAIKKEEEKKGY